MSPLPGIRTVAAFLLGFGLAVSFGAASLGALYGRDQRLHERVNAVRAEHHLLELRPRADLAAVALGHARDMARGAYLAHVDRAGRNPLERVRAAGVEGFVLLAENIGATNVAGEREAAVVEEWLLSPTHRENLLNPAFHASGIGVAETADGATIYVQLYATFTEPEAQDPPPAAR